MRTLPLVIFANGEKVVIGEVNIPYHIEDGMDVQINTEFLRYSSNITAERLQPKEVFIDVSRSTRE